MPAPLGDYVVFVDESGDHSLTPANPEYPVFVLALVIFRFDDYLGRFLPDLHGVKYTIFGNDAVVLHEREIRRRLGHFGGRFSSQQRSDLLTALTELVAAANFRIIHIVVDKKNFSLDEHGVRSIYHLALGEAMHKLQQFLLSMGCSSEPVPVLFESRGRAEDADLAAEFKRLLRSVPGGLDLQFHSVEKRANIAGLQLANLVARPLGLKYLNPLQPNRSFDALAEKLLKVEDL